MSGNAEQKSDADAALNAEGLALIAAKLVDLGYAVPEGADIGGATCEVLQLLSDAAAQAEEQLATAKRVLASQKGQTTLARKALALAEASLPAKARAIGPLEKQPEGLDLLDAINDADEVELAFSDGETEIVALKPRTIPEGAFEYQGTGRVALNVPEMRVHGPRSGEDPYRLAGYGLFLDGKLAAWSDRGGVLTIVGGTQHELKGDVVF